MEFLERLTLPEIVYPLLGVFGLLLVWQYHQNQVLAGRIYAVDFWDISGIRMFMHASIGDGQACLTCGQANGTFFLPSLATKKNFSTLEGHCSSDHGCRCLIIGLYGGWPEASRLVHKLRKSSKKKPIKLSHKEVLKLFEGPWQEGISGTTDRLTIHMLEAMHLESKDRDGAIFRYRYVVEQARGARDLRLLVPAYLRLTEVLRRANRPQEALEVIDKFEARFSKKKAVFYYPSEQQREEIADLKAKVVKAIRRSQTAAQQASPVQVMEQEREVDLALVS